MLKSIGLALAYYVCQVMGLLAATVCCLVYLFVTKQPIEQNSLTLMAMAPSLLFGVVFMLVFLHLTSNLNKEKSAWSPVSVSYLLLTIVLYASFVIPADFLMSHLSFLPNILEATFDNLQASWLGIFSIAVFGPVLEELLFRGAITRELLKRYKPHKAIFLSALIFGLFHINPAQVVNAFLVGLVFAWIYYKSGSLVPCILLHVLNNSLSVYLSLKFPEAETMGELLGGGTAYYLLVVFSVVVFAGMFLLMRRMPERQCIHPHLPDHRE